MNKQRLTWNEIAEKYPDQWIGLSDIDWEDGANIRSAVVKFTGKSSSELLELCKYTRETFRRSTPHPKISNTKCLLVR